MSDPFAQFARGLQSPAEKHFQITPTDTEDLAIVPRVLRVLTDGNLRVQALDAVTGDLSEVTYPVFAGEEFKLRVVRVMATGTTATVKGWL